MNTAPRWQHCIAHYDRQVTDFVQQYFSDKGRTCLLVAGAGFDPRSATIAQLLAKAAGESNGKLRALFVRERRLKHDPELVSRGDTHAQELCKLVPGTDVIDIEVLSRDDSAVVGGHRAVQAMRDAGLGRLDAVTDVVLDMSALSIGISFPVARFLLEACENASPMVSFHVMVASAPELDAAISSIPNDAVDAIRGFSGTIDLAESAEEPKIWLPHLASRRNSALQLIRDKLPGPVDVCPVLPLSQRDPRAADRLISEFESELYQDWEVDPRNLIYAIEDDPLDLYRTISSIYRRYVGVFSKITPAHVVLSPSGNKVLAIGALMAALENSLPVRYVEAVRYEVDWTKIADVDPLASHFVHVWLHGPPYEHPAVQSVAADPTGSAHEKATTS
jgi:hypothetical protein